MKQRFEVIVLGGGAAGLMTAIEAGKRGKKVAVLERSSRVGKKILISGGGRCNFTNLACQPENFISTNPHFARSALAYYKPEDFIYLVEKHGIPYHEKTLGQLFCDRSASDIVNMLISECDKYGVQIRTNVHIDKIDYSTGFTIRVGSSEFSCSALVIATGGLSIPKMGATAFGYEVALQFGLKIVAPRPALVPLVWNKEDRLRYADLSGISLRVVASTRGQRFQESMLFTHGGLSGPAILQVSSYWSPGTSITLDLAPHCDITASVRAGPRRDLASLKIAFRNVLPQRFADCWLNVHPLKGWTNESLLDLERLAHQWPVTPTGTEGYGKAEVTCGGVDTDELFPKTMESRKVPGLYFVGEVVDVTGHLGGFNFQWAWASGFCAGQAA